MCKYARFLNVCKMSLRLEPRVSHLQQLGFAHCFENYNFSKIMQKMKKPDTHADLIRTEISILSLFDRETQTERVLSARCVSRNNISHRKSLFEQRMTEFIEQNYTVAYMAYLCNMSVTAFKKRFSEYYELPPHRWFVKQHLHRAVELLLSEDLSIKEVCHRSHFANYSHFIECFRREYGLTPRQYQERYKAQPINR